MSSHVDVVADETSTVDTSSIAKRFVKVDHAEQLERINKLASCLRKSDILQPRRYQILLAKHGNGEVDDAKFDELLRKIYTDVTAALVSARALLADPFVFDFVLRTRTVNEYANAWVAIQRAHAVNTFRDREEPFHQGVVEQCLNCGLAVEAFLVKAKTATEGRPKAAPASAAIGPQLK